jgi:serine/threonine protein kinase
MRCSISLDSGTLLNKYQLHRRVGGGHFGEVWLARDTYLDRDIAVKVQALSKGTVNDALQEARIGNHLNHRNLVKVHSADTLEYRGETLLLIAMDFYPDGSITKRFNEMGFIALHDAIRYLTDILKGLEHLHGNGLYHGDIKPNNVLIGQGNEAVLTDYGISCYAADLVPVQPKTFYYPHVAPETIRDNQISVQTDIYQVGMTAFRLLNGENKIKTIFEHKGIEDYCDLVLQGKVIQPGDYLPFIPRNLKTILGKATRVDPSRRYQTALEMRRALEGLNYPGYWTCDSEGNFLGYSGKNTYFFSSELRERGRYNFAAKKKGKSGRVVKMTKYSQKNVGLKEMVSLKQKFMLSVVTGKNPK